MLTGVDFYIIGLLESVWTLHYDESRCTILPNPLLDSGYSPQFSGHETFPLRYGWLKKVYDRVAETQESGPNRASCWGDDAIARFGVGKNMVVAMRHWAKAAGIIETPAANSVRTTPFGDYIFSPTGFDPYMEEPDTLWLIHWQLASKPERTTWFWAFSHYPTSYFEREQFEKLLSRFAAEQGWRPAAKTIKNDVACFIRTYVARKPTRKAGYDDALESPLTELGLIRELANASGFRFARGPKPGLSDVVFVAALENFWWHYYRTATTLSFTTIAHTPGSPGRVFLLDDSDIVDRLARLEDVTSGKLRWTETAGLQQVVRNFDWSERSLLGLAEATPRAMQFNWNLSVPPEAA